MPFSIVTARRYTETKYLVEHDERNPLATAEMEYLGVVDADYTDESPRLPSYEVSEPFPTREAALESNDA